MRHTEHKDRQRQDSADPESSRHVSQFRIILFADATWRFQLKRHAANRAIARMVLLDLRVHRARINHFPTSYLNGLTNGSRDCAIRYRLSSTPLARHLRYRSCDR